MPMTWQHIDTLRLITQSVIPTTFDDSLSYYEILAKVLYKLNEVIEIVNKQGEGIETYILELFASYKVEWEKETDAKLLALKNDLQGQFDDLSDSFDTFTNSINNKFDSFQSDINKQLSAYQNQINQQVSDLYQLILSTDTANRNWTIALLEEFKQQLPKDYPPIIDPTDGKLEDVQTVVNHMWDRLNKDSLTAEEYDSLELTTTEYDDKYLTATQYDQYGRIYLMPETS